MSRTWLAGAGLALACLLCYANSFQGSFHYDDFHSIVDNPSIRSLANVPRFFVDPKAFSADAEKAMYRPVLLLTYAVNYCLGGYAVWGYHLVNLSLHLGCALLVWALARRLVGGGWIGWWCGLVFAVHPLATEPVNYISSRSESLMACLFLAAFLGHLEREERPGCGYLSFGALALALLSKPVAITAPVLMWLCDRWQGKKVWGAKLYAAHAALVGGYLLVILGNRTLTGSLEAPVRNWGSQVWTQAKAPAYYLKLLLVPWGLNVEHQFSESTEPGRAAVLAGLALTGSLVFLAWKGRRHLPGWALGWAGLVLLPTAAMPLNVLVNERRLYLVLAGFAWLWGYLLRGQRLPVMAMCLPLFGLLTFGRNQVWRDELSLWQDAAAKAPGMYPVQANLGKALQLAGHPEAALQAYTRALEIDPRYGEAYNNIATLYHQQGRLDEAVAWYQRALERYPGYEEIYQNLADAYSRQGKLDQAIRMYEHALAIEGRSGAIWGNYGQTLYQAGQLDRAEQAFQKTIELMPGQPEPYNNLGNLYSSRGDLARAASMYQQALERHPGQRAEVLGNLADTYREMGRLDQARQVLDEAAQLDPGRGRTFYYLGKLERQGGRSAQAMEALERAVELEPGYPKAYAELAELRAEGRDYAGAVGLFQQAVRLDPGYSRAWYGLARSLEQSGQRDQAAPAYRRFLELWSRPDQRRREAEERLRRLEGRG